MKQWWRRWTYEIPLAIGDALWDTLVVELAALLDRITLRKVIAFIPVAIIVLAYYHRIPIPPELILIGDFLAYIDVFSMLFLLGVFSRITTILFIIRQAATRISLLMGRITAHVQRLDVRHRRHRGALTRRRRKPRRSDEDRAYGSVWCETVLT